MAWLLNTISDTSNEVVVSCTAASAEGAATVVDASSLLGNAGAGTEVLDIAAISWCSNGALTLEFDATTDDKAMVLTGNGKMGGTDGFGVLRKNPKSSGYTGDILATSAGSAFFIMKLRKSEGYS